MNKQELVESLKELDFPTGDYYLLSSDCLKLYRLRNKISNIDLCKCSLTDKKIFDNHDFLYTQQLFF